MGNKLIEPPHPEGRSLTDFERHLLRLRLIGHEAKLLVCGLLRAEDRKKDLDLLLTLQNYGYILVCRFLEIWSKFNALGKDNRRVREISRAAKPLLDRINKWPGLREYRNWVLAHSYQVKNDPAFIPPWVVLKTGRLPVGPLEVLILVDSVRVVVAMTMAYYGDIYRTLSPILEPGTIENAPDEVVSDTEAQQQRIGLGEIGNAALSSLGVPLDDPVFREFKCGE